MSPPAPAGPAPLYDPAALERSLHDGPRPLLTLKRILQQGDAELKRRFEQGTDVESLVRERAALVDALLGKVFALHLAGLEAELALDRKSVV